jgi:hypothetical protein
VGRRWWIGSFLDCVETATGATPEEYATIETLFQKILRGYNCGKDLSEQYYEVTDFDFPVIPTDDTDLWMGVWTDSEITFAIQFIRSLMQVHNPYFRKPPGSTGQAPQTDEQWNEWVRQMIKQLCQVETFKFDKLYIVSFIDT